MRGFVRFIRRRGWGQAASLFVGIASILIGAALSNRWGNPFVSIFLCLVGTGLVVLAVVCFIIGPADESSDAEAVAQVGLEVPPDTPVRLPDGVPRDTTVRISASEDLEEENDERAGDESSEP